MTAPRTIAYTGAPTATVRLAGLAVAFAGLGLLLFGFVRREVGAPGAARGILLGIALSLPAWAALYIVWRIIR